MRGNRRQIFDALAGAGTIPAHAGEPLDDNLEGLSGGDYPRACGGTDFWVCLIEPVQGLSPRMRGNRCRC